MIGHEIASTPGISAFERFYIRLLGVPISGLRIRLRRVLPKLTGNPRKVLDAGCGRGVFSYQLARRFPEAEVIAVDIDEAQLEKNRTIAGSNDLHNLDFQKKDIGSLDYEQEFDLVLSVDNLEHLEDDKKGLQGLFNALKPGGRIVLHVPGYERRWFFFKFQTNFDVPGHYRPGYYLDDIKSMMQSAGFEVESAAYTFGWLETVTNNVSYFVTRAEAKNKLIYAAIFPLLNVLAWCGQGASPEKGAGVLLTGHRPG
jgi:2-polyprenyl-3-methyl-5-hydroxy-6-metoxy-1,4-benzoquinol methylase